MKKKLFVALATTLGLTVTFSIGFVCGQMSEAAYRFRNETALAIAMPGMVDLVQSGRWSSNVLVRSAVDQIENEKRFLRNPFSIYPHPPQSYEKMPHRVAWLDRAIQGLEHCNEGPDQQSGGYALTRLWHPPDLTAETTLRLHQLMVSIDLYEHANGLWPPTLETLLFDARHQHEIHSASPFTIPPMLLDPWGQKIRYLVKGDHYVLLSAGPDGHFETRDDIRTEK
jgi:hypothetical protein